MKAKSVNQVKKEFEARGESFASWAEENGYDRFYVYKVLSGAIKGKRGIGHEIAVKLGLK